MKQGRRWLLVGALILVAVAGLAVMLEPSGTGRAFLAGEPFYRYRPLRHWREVFRTQGQQGFIDKDLHWRFSDLDPSLPVLLACMRDPDPNVRWPAIVLLGREGRGKQRPLTAMIDSLQDDNLEARLKAISALRSWGTMAKQAVPALTQALHDKELQVNLWADLALWDIDVPSAVKATGWTLCRSSAWRFSVMLPGEPELSQRQAALTQLPLHCFAAWHKIGLENGPTRYMIGVCEYPDEVVRASTENERLEAAAQWSAFGVNGKIVREREIQQNGRKGREHTIVVEKKRMVRVRNFWLGRRLYIAMFASQPKFLNAKAAEYFLDSFRFEEAR